MAKEARRAADNIKPILTDEEVLEFCKTGFLTIEGVIPDSTNRWVFEYLNEEGADPHQFVPCWAPASSSPSGWPTIAWWGR